MSKTAKGFRRVAVLMLTVSLVSSCGGHAKPLSEGEEYCERVNAIDDEYRAKYKDVWEGQINANDVSQQLEEQVALEREQLSRVQEIPPPKSHAVLAHRYLSVLNESVLSEEEYVRRYQSDKSVKRSAAAVHLRAEAKHLSLELAQSCK